jgi:hypothetical protein
VSKLLQVTGIIIRTLTRSQVQKHARLKICNTSALHRVLYGRETWAIREQDKSAEMKFVKRTANYTWQDYRTNEDMLSELKINPVVKKIRNDRNK